MKHVFVESNWVFDYCAPAHLQTPEAQSLVFRAAAGELTLHVPNIALREGEKAIQKGCKPKIKPLMEFARWAVSNQQMAAEDRAALQPFVTAFQASIQSAMDTLSQRVDAVRALANVEVFALDDEMLEKAIEVRSFPDLTPFDEAIFGAVLVKASRVRRAAEDEVFFCELDGDLAPVVGHNHVRPDFAAAYKAAGITFRRDFLVP